MSDAPHVAGSGHGGPPDDAHTTTPPRALIRLRTRRDTADGDVPGSTATHAVRPPVAAAAADPSPTRETSSRAAHAGTGRKTGRRLAVVGLALALAVTAVASAVAATAAEEEAPPVEVADPPFRLRGDGDATALVPEPPVQRFTAGQATIAELLAYESPYAAPGQAPVARAPNPTREGFPLVVSVIETTPDGAWMRVRLPMRPNGTAGWVRATDVRAWQVPNRVEVTLAEHRLRVFDGDSDVVLYETDVAVGRGDTPTPVGDFYIDIVNPLGGHEVYGWGQLSVAGFSEVLERFAGGIGQIALHGWNNDDIMGSSVSNGCVRMRNADIARVAELAPLGTPVSIRP